MRRASSWAVSLFAHGGVAAVLLIGVPWPEPPGAVDQGLLGIEISLAAGGIPSMPEPSPPPPEPEKVVEKPVEPPPAPEPEPVKAPDVVESLSTQPDIEEAPKPKPKPVADAPRRPQPPKPKEVVKAPEPAPQPQPQPQEQQVAVAPSPVPPSQSQLGQRPAPNSGNGAAATSGGNPGAEADYFAKLLAWLERHKEYPRRAQMRRIEGVTHLRFTIDGQGHVLRYNIERSSGHASLDEAVERMIKKAEPLPAIPAVIGKDRLELVVPVQFLLK